ncbi:MAG: ion transporter [Bacteroidota bacterium]
MNWKRKLHEIIFEADTPEGKTFDLILLLMIVLSVLVVILESVDFINQRFSGLFFYLEWIFTILFTIEYVLRILSVGKPWKYITSFYGIVDLFSILPTYLSLFFAGTHYLITIRALRLLRIFRILKLGNYLTESRVLLSALKASQQKITVFLVAVLTIVLIVGATMYLIEGGEENGFDSIPRSMYWAIVTVTTVGYGDITPSTTLGQFLSAILMVMGYGILAVPTGIISAELTQIQAKGEQGYNTQSCPSCSREGHDNDATFCKFCGSPL